MLSDAGLLEFLWENAVEHVAYLCNRSYTSSIKNATPYQLWFGTKPTVSHLREFGAPVWILLQGPNTQWKMLPKSVRHAYVGYDNRSKSVKYYTAEARKILLT